MKYLGILPQGINRDNIPLEQRTFLFYLLGNVPSLETVQKIVSYETKLNDIHRKNWKRRLIKDQGKDYLEVMAKMEKQSFQDYVQSVAEQNKKLEIQALNEVFGIIDKEKSQINKIEKLFAINRDTINKLKEEEKLKENPIKVSKQSFFDRLRGKKNGK